MAGDLTHDLRAKCDEDTHRIFHAICTANGEDSASCIRRLVQEYVQAEIRKHTLMQRLLRGEGLLPDSAGNHAE